MVELWLIRHGETYDNLSRTLAGQKGGELTKLGLLQAQKTG